MSTKRATSTDNRGILFTPEGIDFQLHGVRIDLATRAATADPRLRLELWYHWARLSVLHLRSATVAHKRMLRTDASAQQAEMLKAMMEETMSSMQAVACTAFALEAFSLALQESLPPTHRPSARSAAQRLIESIAGAFKIGPKSRQSLEDPIRMIFRLRNLSVHAAYQFQSVSKHPTTGHLVDWHRATFHVTNARNAVGLLCRLYRQLPALARREHPEVEALACKLKKLSPRLRAIRQRRIDW